jgi:hypothetical protein
MMTELDITPLPSRRINLGGGFRQEPGAGLPGCEMKLLLGRWDEPAGYACAMPLACNDRCSR